MKNARRGKKLSKIIFIKGFIDSILFYKKLIQEIYNLVLYLVTLQEIGQRL